jgi:pimeloyl-ACP methyl ester carboxylesterase
VVTETDLKLGVGRTLHVYDTGADDADGRLAIFWHHGTPNFGAPPEPLFASAARLGIRWVSYDRPGYGGSTPHPDRDVASAADDTSSVADALSIDRFAVMGHSGGGSHALACAALLPERVLGVVSVAGLAPFDAEGLDWFAGMSDSGVASLGAAAEGRAAKERFEASGAEYDPEMFTPEGPRRALRGMVLAARGRQPGCGGRTGRAHRRPRLRRPVGIRPRAGSRAGPLPSRRPGSGRAQLARRVARAPLPLGRTVAEPG